MVRSHCMLLPEHMQNGTFHHRPHITGICRLVCTIMVRIYLGTCRLVCSITLHIYLDICTLVCTVTVGMYLDICRLVCTMVLIYLVISAPSMSMYTGVHMQAGLYHQGPCIPGEYTNWSVPSLTVCTWVCLYLGMCRLVSSCIWAYADWSLPPCPYVTGYTQTDLYHYIRIYLGIHRLDCIISPPIPGYNLQACLYHQSAYIQWYTIWPVPSQATYIWVYADYHFQHICSLVCTTVRMYL